MRFSVAIHKKRMNGQADQSVKIPSYRDADVEISNLKESSTLNNLLRCFKGHSNNSFGNQSEQAIFLKNLQIEQSMQF